MAEESTSPRVDAAAAETAARYDLTSEVARSLDRHLVFPLLEFLSQRELYPLEELEAAKLELIEHTNMVDYAVDIYQGLNGTNEIPARFASRRSEVVAKLKSLEAAVRPVTDFLSSEDRVKLLKQDKAANAAFLAKEFGIGSEQIDALFAFAKWNFECGNYSAAAEYLYHFRTLSTDPAKMLSALWGRLAADVLLQDFHAAMDDLLRLKELVDVDSSAPVAHQLASRTWLMHVALFVCFNHENGLNALADLFLSDRYTTALTLCAQHLLRYLSVALVVNRRRRGALKDLVRIISQEAYEYHDPVTEFLRCLFVESDFDGARIALSQCESVLDNDFFLASAKGAFMETARTFLFEAYCRVHSRIDLSALSQQLGLDREGTEKWIVRLIRDARLDAKIDSSAGAVVIASKTPGEEEALFDKARSLSLRTFNLANTLVGILRG